MRALHSVFLKTPVKKPPELPRRLSLRINLRDVILTKITPQGLYPLHVQSNDLRFKLARPKTIPPGRFGIDAARRARRIIQKHFFRVREEPFPKEGNRHPGPRRNG